MRPRKHRFYFKRRSHHLDLKNLRVCNRLSAAIACRSLRFLVDMESSCKTGDLQRSCASCRVKPTRVRIVNLKTLVELAGKMNNVEEAANKRSTAARAKSKLPELAALEICLVEAKSGGERNARRNVGVHFALREFDGGRIASVEATHMSVKVHLERRNVSRRKLERLGAENAAPNSDLKAANGAQTSDARRT